MAHPLRRAVDSVGVRYLVIGAWNTLFSYLLFWLCYHLLGDWIGYGGALTVSTGLSIVQSYATQRILVWRSGGAIPGEFTRFLLTNAGMYLLNLAVLALLVELLGMPVLPAQLIATVVVVVAGFLLLRSFTFRRADSLRP